ncbi:putative membrane protein/YHS domain-containing protein [Pseudochelatococcus lubricantis]|uniref:Membrane protein/YHS domain-containing protein n=1 Tax=Pseudochelatococcus lubricantis TaxID=1538102 RepID=A0ABX0V3R8_9HYPH|nr:Fe-S-containing protein [Pseudochelatococcus lubricantis]NIJ59015.1 putative membrane protein/YHS domain-containing protein [Pseudochelatococcus lubricantis]
MAYYITIVAQTLTVAALAAALWPFVAGAREAGRAGTLLALLAGAAGGFIAVAAAVGLPRSATAIATLVHAAALVVVLSGLLLLPFAARIGRASAGWPALWRLAAGCVLIATVSTQGVFDAWRLSANHTLTATDVINTELIVNCAAIVIALAALTALGLLLARVARLAGHTASTLALAAALLLLTVAGAEKTLLGMLRIDLVPVTAGRVSLVARLSIITPWLAYGHLVIALGLAATALARRLRIPEDVAGRIERRRLRARGLGERRWRNGLAATAAFLLAVMLYQDLYASRPPRLSEAVEMVPDERGTIRIPVENVKDGNLHRFAYIASDGHRVRFFLVNRYDEAHASIGVVLDACLICGEGGYVQRGEEIFCIACNVRMYRPSIGKPGGCNPIPLDHTLADGVIVIAAGALEKGTRYFSEVVEITVADPVSGAAVKNTNAPYQYEHNGRTWFFENRDTYDRFRATPDAFVKPTPGQPGRV